MKKSSPSYGQNGQLMQSWGLVGSGPRSLPYTFWVGPVPLVRGRSVATDCVAVGIIQIIKY
jgi:hypothetical protein